MREKIFSLIKNILVLGVTDNKTVVGQGYNERNIREQSGKVFPSELEMMTGRGSCLARTDYTQPTMPR